MKKITITFLILLLTNSIFIQKVFYVSQTGNDNNKGTIEQPFKTLEAAREAIRSLKATGDLSKGVKVYLRAGN